jgi:hypothetical protein
MQLYLRSVGGTRRKARVMTSQPGPGAHAEDKGEAAAKEEGSRHGLMKETRGAGRREPRASTLGRGTYRKIQLNRKGAGGANARARTRVRLKCPAGEAAGEGEAAAEGEGRGKRLGQDPQGACIREALGATRWRGAHH